MTWPRAWRARWIWLEDAREFVFFRAVLESADARDVPARATADGRYILWCNGEELSRGPVRSEPSQLTYDPVTLPLRAGRNVVCALVRHYGRPTLYWKPAIEVPPLGHGGFLFESDVLSSGDRRWRARSASYVGARSDAFEGPPDPEVLRAREMTGWWDASDGDAGWEPATVLHTGGLGIAHPEPPIEPFAHLRPRPIPQLRATMREPAASWDHGELRIYDFGTITNAHPIVESDGDVVVMAGEDLDDDGSVVMDVRDWRMRLEGGGRMEAFEPIGFRYLAVAGAHTEVAARERTYPREPIVRFVCDDDELNAIWEAGARALDLCSTDAYIDCPSREQRAWLGDATLSALIGMTVNPDVRLPVWNLRLHASGQRPDGLLPMTAANDFSMRAYTIPDFTLHWITGLARVYEYTGDAEIVHELLPAALRALDAFEALRAPNGLVEDVPGWIFIDWAQTERGRHIAAMDALHILALDDAAMCARAIGDAGSAARLDSRAASARAAFEQYLDPVRGVYTDVLGGRRVSQQTNALAVLVGAQADHGRILDVVCDPARIRRTRTPADPGTLAERVSSQLMPLVSFEEEHDVVEAQPFFAHFLHQALARAGRIDAIVASIRRWGPMVARNGLVEEYWEAPPGRGSRCHVWAGTPTYDLTTHVLGARIAAPGWTKVIVEPHLGALRFARGAVPTPRGLILIEARDDGSAQVSLPPGTVGEFRAGARIVVLSEGRNEIGAP